MILNITVCSIGPDQLNSMCVRGMIIVERQQGPQKFNRACTLRVCPSQHFEIKEETKEGGPDQNPLKD